MLRNKEFRQFAVFYMLIATIFILFGFAINKETGILIVTSTIVFGGVFFRFTKARYKKIAQISYQIDRVLHNADHLSIHESEEGELAILTSEVTKMTLRIRERNEQLKQEKDHLANSLADIAHQLRTPLTSINLILTLLANTTDENERKAFLREAEGLLVQMDWLITALLKLSRLDAGIVTFRSEPVGVKNLIETALRPFLIQIELHDIHLQIDVPPEIMIQGDCSWLSEAIQNILKNCIESVGKGGKIEICCDDNLLFTEILICDYGVGFDTEDLARLFDRFYRGKSSSATGYGIGLALCKMIITQQGGTVLAKNHPQGGAVFTIRFPK